MLPQMEIAHSKQNQIHKIDSEVPGAWAQGGGCEISKLYHFSWEKRMSHEGLTRKYKPGRKQIIHKEILKSWIFSKIVLNIFPKIRSMQHAQKFKGLF